MKYLKKYQKFLESNLSNSEEELIDLISNIELISKKNGIDPKQNEEEIAKELINKIEANKQLSNQIDNIEQEIKSQTNESIDYLQFDDVLNSIEYSWKVDKEIATDNSIIQDIHPDKEYKEISSKIKNIWKGVIKIVKFITGPVRYIFDLFEKIIFWISSKIFTFEKSFKVGKLTFALLSITTIITALLVVGSLSTVASGLGFISGLVAILKQGIIWTKFKTIAQSVWSFIRRVKQTSSTELGHIVTPVEFFDYINKIFRNNELGISKDVHEIQNFFMSQDDKVKRLISQKFCDILGSISIISPDGKQNFAPKKWGTIDKDNQINFDELVQTPYLRGLLLPIIPEKKLKADFNWKKIWVWKEETIDDFKKHIGLEITDKLDKYLDKQSKVIANRFESSLKDLKDFGKENAEILFKAMDGPGTDEEAIYSVFDKIKSEDYFWSIYLEFGLRQENDLIEWLFGDLNENDLYELSLKLKNQIDWKEGWNVSGILKGSLEEYHKNNPDWSISISKF